MTNRKGSIIAGSFWMILVSALLFWLPFVGPAIGGVVGGMKAGTLGGAICAVFLPIVVVVVLVFIFAESITGIPIIGAIAGTGVTVLLVSEVGPMLLGSIVGAILA